MQTELYDEIKKGLQEHFKELSLSKSYAPCVVGIAPTNPTYPLIIVDETDNVPYQNLRHFRQTVASVSYKIDIYAKTSGSISKQEIAKHLAIYCDDYLKKIGLKQVSYNVFPDIGTNGALYNITLMYTARFFENKKYFV